MLPLKTVGQGKWLYKIAFSTIPRNTDEDRFVLRAERVYPSTPDKKEYIDLNQDGETKVCQFEKNKETCFLLRWNNENAMSVINRNDFEAFAANLLSLKLGKKVGRKGFFEQLSAWEC